MSRSENDLSRRIDMLVKALSKEKKDCKKESDGVEIAIGDIEITSGDSEGNTGKLCGVKRTFGEMEGEESGEEF